MTTGIATDRLDRIAHVSTCPTVFADGQPMRWTELSIFFDPNHRRPFVAQVVGRSIEHGEVDRVRQRRAKTIDQAADLFDASDPGEACRKQAQDWEDASGLIGKTGEPPRIQFDGKRGLLGALTWLYPGVHASKFADTFADDFGVPARTVRHALMSERNAVGLPSWCLAFLGAMQHFDRESFHEMRRPS